jgi:hypothetical protein
LDTVTIEYDGDADTGTETTNVSANATVTVPVKACHKVDIKVGSTVVESFTMPFGATFPKIVGASAAAAIVNNNLSVTVNVYRDGLFIGDIKKNKSTTFKTGLVAGNVITVRRADNNVLVKTVTLVVDTNTINVP